MAASPRSEAGLDPVAVSRLIALGRVGIGVALVVAPGLFPRLVAGTTPREDAIAMTRIAGARDLGMGLGAALAARGGASPELRRWVAASALADAVDALAIARSGSFRPVPRLLAAAAGGSAAVLGLLAVRRLPGT